MVARAERGGRRHVAVAQVSLEQRRVALRRVAIASAAGQAAGPHDALPARPSATPCRAARSRRRGPRFPAHRGCRRPGRLAGCAMRSNIALNRISWPSAAPISTTCPSPPRCLPAPPESGRSSLRQTTIGPTCSVASIDMVRTPLGKAVALIPSSVGRAPLPPLLNIRISARRAPRRGGIVRAAR